MTKRDRSGTEREPSALDEPATTREEFENTPGDYEIRSKTGHHRNRSSRSEVEVRPKWDNGRSLGEINARVERGEHYSTLTKKMATGFREMIQVQIHALGH